ncbi:MAG TPA: hypothetical protein DF383_00890 [Deltaproteobacteria bacterium]|nr:hypothetical protein [Deltaproteobacteria bacterium]
MTPLLELKNLVSGFPGRPLTTPLTLQVAAGSRLGIIGGNGSGKTTLVKTLLGLRPPLSGTVFWKKGIRFSYVPQENQVDMLFPLTISDLLKMGMVGGLSRWRRFSPRVRQALQSVLKEMELTPLAEVLLRDLSGGERQRALIGRAWISRPQTLLMDEPFNSLDYRFKEKLWRILKEWQMHHDLTLLLIDHDLNRVINQVDHLIVLGSEKTLGGPTAEILQPETLSQAYGAPLHVHRENGHFQVHFL